MKKVKVNRVEEIDFSKKQWLISKDFVVLSSGTHSDRTFSGTVLPCKMYPEGDYSQGWSKELFVVLTYDIPFTISNDND